MADRKTNDIIANHPFVVGDRVKVVVGLEELREMVLDCWLYWNAGEMKKVKHFAFEDAMCVNRWKERV
jgi:hypothetical protein